MNKSRQNSFGAIVVARLLAVTLPIVCAVFVLDYFHSKDSYQKSRDFGVVSSIDSLDSWADKTGVKPTMPVEFEAWSKNRTLKDNFAKAKKLGYKKYMVTWEPWKTVAASLGVEAQGKVQTEYSNIAIASGFQDRYITAFAKSVASSGLETVYIRYAHEVNGTWYPWSNDSEQYIKAWRRIVDIFRSVGASNAKFVFSTNPSLYQNDASWTSRFWKYYPGNDYVDYVGSTMINFGLNDCVSIPCPGYTKGYSVELFKQRITLSNKLTGKQIIISELNTALQEDTEDWLNQLNDWISSDKEIIKAVVLSQLPSRGAAQMDTGNMDWNISDEPKLHEVLKKIFKTVTEKDESSKNIEYKAVQKIEFKLN